jgi:hypothetical protein
MTSQRVPLDILMQTVFTSVDGQLQAVKSSIFTAAEMDSLLKEVETGQQKLEEQLQILKG